MEPIRTNSVTKELFRCPRCKRVLNKKEGLMRDREGRVCKKCIYDPKWIKTLIEKKKRVKQLKHELERPKKRLTRKEWLVMMEERIAEGKLQELKEKKKILL